MADFRQIHTQIWDDDWFVELSIDERMLFLWLITNRRASVSGIYEFSYGVAARETNIDRTRVIQIIEKFIASDKVMVDDKYIWVKNLRKYNHYPNPNSNKRIMNDINELPDGEMKRQYLEYYGDTYEAPMKPLDSPYEAPTKPLPSPLVAPTKPLAIPFGNIEHRTKNIEHRTKNTRVARGEKYDKEEVLNGIPDNPVNPFSISSISVIQADA